MKMVSYKIVRAPNGDLCVAYGKQYFPTNIAAMILKGIKQTAKKYYGKSVSNAKEIMNVGLMARLHPLLLINEPIVAISYGLINKEGLIATADLGDRNFDVSILRISDGDLNIVGKHDPFLGGEDFDNVIMEYLVSEIKYIHGIDATI
ncbi:hypothetical protein IFM89_033592 [Coptis chinensis]|uniref:Uncharacterized protein n=1 Tax=Coptis chinensis TaxID=261450 RepID=A0A835LX70_9MAGN|nr:hypothetical protein IFM89_033592 [Coptis chinensis]